MCKQRLLKPFTLRITGSVSVQASDACVSVEHRASWYVLSFNARDNRRSVHVLESKPNVVCANVSVVRAATVLSRSQRDTRTRRRSRA